MNRRVMLGVSAAAVTWMARVDLSRRPLPNLRWGCASLTWNGDDRQAIGDIGSLGYRGIQLRTAAVETWGSRPGELADLLAANHLTFTALSSGLLRLDPAFESEDRQLHLQHAKFLRASGGSYLQVIDERPAGREPTNDDYRRLGHLLSDLGKRVGDLGVQLGYHHHMGAMGQSPEQVARVMDASDPKFVKLVLDTAHYQQGGGDPATAVKTYAERLLFLHIKDLESPVPGDSPDSYRFLELGAGRVDFPAVFAALEQVGFTGWAIVELDQVPVANRSPKDSALLSKQYLQRSGFTL